MRTGRESKMSTASGPSGNQLFDELIRQAYSDLEKCDEHVRASKETRLQMWSLLAGSALEGMLENPEVAEGYLEHSDPRLRIAALCILRDHWKQTGRFASQCQQMALNDIDLGVQGVAVTSLGVLHAGTSHPGIGHLLAGIVRDQSKDVSVRLYAYNALFELRGLPANVSPLWQEAFHKLRFPEDIDWSFVESFLRD